MITQRFTKRHCLLEGTRLLERSGLNIYLVFSIKHKSSSYGVKSTFDEFGKWHLNMIHRGNCPAWFCPLLPTCSLNFGSCIPSSGWGECCLSSNAHQYSWTGRISIACYSWAKWDLNTFTNRLQSRSYSPQLLNSQPVSFWAKTGSLS